MFLTRCYKLDCNTAVPIKIYIDYKFHVIHILALLEFSIQDAFKSYCVQRNLFDYKINRRIKPYGIMLCHFFVLFSFYSFCDFLCKAISYTWLKMATTVMFIAWYLFRLHVYIIFTHKSKVLRNIITM